MNRLSQDKLEQIVAVTLTGAGLNATAHALGISENAVARNLYWLGEACQRYHDEKNVGLPCDLVECDELVSFVYAKEKGLPMHMKGSPEVGQMYTWVAIDPTSKFVICWRVAKQTPADCELFAYDLRRRLAKPKPQITTDGLAMYAVAIEKAFGSDVDYATINKLLGEPEKIAERYQQPELLSMRKASKIGNPDMDEVRTTSIERQNATLRHISSRYKRHHYMISKKLANKRAALALTYMYYNFCRVHMTLRCTPAMELGITDHVWEIPELLALMPAREVRRPKTYRKRSVAC